MESWSGWPLERLIYAFVAVGYFAAWAQLTLMHWRGAFRRIEMWGPVVFTPILLIVTVIYLFSRGGFLDTLFVIVMAIGLLEGLAGTFFHLRGVASQVGGINLRNLATGPPPLLPLIYGALGGFALLTYYWPSITGVAR